MLLWKISINSEIIMHFNQDSITSETRMILLNAVYFKADWAIKFNKARTMLRRFYLNTFEVQWKMTPMMHIVSTFRLGHIPECDARVLELPYQASSGNLDPYYIPSLIISIHTAHSMFHLKLDHLTSK